jgi:large subunit ribosomal protein L29
VTKKILEMKMSEIKELATKEIQERIDTDKDILVRFKLNHVVSTMDNPMKIKHTRKDIARLMTELRHRTILEQNKSSLNHGK